MDPVCTGLCCDGPGKEPGTYGDETVTTNEPFFRPLSLILVDRDGGAHLVDGVRDDTREHISGDTVERAAWVALLNEALRMLQPPRAVGGLVTGGRVPPGGIHITNPDRSSGFLGNG